MVGNIGECFTEDPALRFVTGKLPAEERSARQAHLDVCDTCQQLIIRSMHALDASEPVAVGGGWWNTMFPRGLLLADRYRVDRFIARGGMGEIYEAFDCVLGMRVAVKTVASTLSDDDEAIAQIKAEVQLALRVSHKNVCRIHGLETHQPESGPAILFLTMELVEGITLGDQLQIQGRFSPGEAARLAAGMLLGLQAAHESNVLHRDLKSDNIMLRAARGGLAAPVLMDFGLASALNPNSSRLSADHAMVGSLAYMAPEQVQGDDLRIATDLYAFGVILFEMLTGRLPFEAPTAAGSALKRLQEPAPHLQEVLPEIPLALDELVARCLERDPKHRFSSAEAVLAALYATNLIEIGLLEGAQRASEAPMPPAPLTRASPMRFSGEYSGHAGERSAPTLGSPTRTASPITFELPVTPTGSAPKGQPWPEAQTSIPPPNRRNSVVIGTLSGLLAAALGALILLRIAGAPLAMLNTKTGYIVPGSAAPQSSGVPETSSPPAVAPVHSTTEAAASAPHTQQARPEPLADSKRPEPKPSAAPLGAPRVARGSEPQRPLVKSTRAEIPPPSAPGPETPTRACPRGLLCPKPLGQRSLGLVPNASTPTASP